MKKFRILYVSCRSDPSLGFDERTGVELRDDHSRLTRKIDMNKRKVIEEYEFESINGTTGPFPDVSSIQGIVIGGSPFMLSEGLPEWGGALQKFLFSAIDKNIPVLGICYGHQFLAKMFGGEVTRIRTYREFGSRRVSLTRLGAASCLFKDIPKHFGAWMSHNEVVVNLPAGVQRLASNGYCDNQAVLFKKNVYGVQFHPELETRNLANLYSKRLEAIADEGLNVDKIKRRYMHDSGIGKKVLSNFLFRVVPSSLKEHSK